MGVFASVLVAAALVAFWQQGAAPLLKPEDWKKQPQGKSAVVTSLKHQSTSDPSLVALAWRFKTLWTNDIGILKI